MAKDKGRLIFDIEISPTIVWVWRTGYGINVPASNVREEGRIICISYKWEHERKIHHLHWDKKQCDRDMLKKFIPIMQQASEIIGHNHNGFDIKWLRTRCLFHRLPCPPDFVTVDTWRDAKKYFRFNSNSLKYISKFLGFEGKLEAPAGLWERAVFDKSKKALKELLRYCDRDVDQTAKVFEAFAPYVKPTGHKGTCMQDCPHCGSKSSHKEKDRTTAAGTKYVQCQCNMCGKYFQVAASKYYTNKAI